MFNHAPQDYRCPFCLVAGGGGDKLSGPDDIVYCDELVTAFIAPKWWVNNPGHVLVVPNEHYENLYDVPETVLANLAIAAKYVAIAMKRAYKCEGVSTRQHNEQAGGQDVWHLHMHVFPRFTDDKLYLNDDKTRMAERSEKHIYADKLRKAMISRL